MNLSKNIIIFKNDAVGDLVQSISSINNIIKHNPQNKIIIYLSERSKDFSFLVDSENVEIRIVNYDLSIIQKIKIFFQLLSMKIYSIYILTPKKFYFYLPLFFKNIKFYALCINSTNNYKRPSNFLRKFLYQYSINDREILKKRKSTEDLQCDLTNDLNFNEKFIINNIPDLKYSKLDDLNNYIYFHLKLSNLNKLGWGYTELNILFDEFLKYRDIVIFTKDIDNNTNLNNYKKDFNYINFLKNETILNNSKVYLFDDIGGSDLYHVIKKSDKVIAFHGMMTNLASIEKKNVLDLFLCEINSIDDFRRYKNAFYEFKPNYNNYDFIVPSKDIDKTIRKMKFFLKK